MNANGALEQKWAFALNHHHHHHPLTMGARSKLWVKVFPGKKTLLYCAMILPMFFFWPEIVGLMCLVGKTLVPYLFLFSSPDARERFICFAF